MAVWICRAGKNSVFFSRFVNDSRIYLTWDRWEIDLRMLPAEQEELRRFVAKECGDVQRSSISNHTGQILVFRDRMHVDDWVIVPSEKSREYSIGIIKSNYCYSADAEDHLRHWRDVEWRFHHIPRASFSQSMQYSLGTYRTIFSLNDTDEFFNFIKKAERDSHYANK